MQSIRSALAVQFNIVSENKIGETFKGQVDCTLFHEFAEIERATRNALFLEESNKTL